MPPQITDQATAVASVSTPRAATRHRDHGQVTRRPARLGRAGRELWDGVMTVYQLSPAEAAILARACRALDRLTRMDAELAESDSLIVTGSTGQPKVNPLLAAADSTERVVDVLLRALSLPMPDEQDGKRRSPAAVAAARARWDRNAVGICWRATSRKSGPALARGGMRAWPGWRKIRARDCHSARTVMSPTSTSRAVSCGCLRQTARLSAGPPVPGPVAHPRGLPGGRGRTAAARVGASLTPEAGTILWPSTTNPVSPRRSPVTRFSMPGRVPARRPARESPRPRRKPT
jgi:hypothetical protein